MNRDTINRINGNLSWLKIAAIVAMFWDHFAYGLTYHFPMFFSDAAYIWMRTPGRICMPIFAFLIAWNYRFNTRNAGNYVRRLAIFAICCEPLYEYYFGFPGNAFIPLALGAWLAYAHDLRPKMLNSSWILTMCGSLMGTALIAAACHGPDILAQTITTWALSRFFLDTNRARWLILGTCLLPLFNGLAWQFYTTYALTAWGIFVCCTATLDTPNAKMPKCLAYGFYPLHILGLTLLFGGA